MANVVKYSLTTQANSLKKGNVVLGMNSVEYGPTSATGYWNGIEVPAGGYVMYIPYSNGNGMTIYSMDNDTELIKIVNEIGLQSFTTAAEALAWAGQQTGLFLVNKAADNIVTDGLVLGLDAGFLPSYPATGNTWYNLGSDNANGTLTNGPTYSNGSINFDGTDDYVNFGQNVNPNFNPGVGDAWSLGAIFKNSQSLPNDNAIYGIAGKRRFNEDNGYTLMLRGGGYNGVLARLSNSGKSLVDIIPTTNFSSILANGRYHQMVMTYGTNDTGSLYIDGVLVGQSVASNFDFNNSTSAFKIGVGDTNNNHPFNGSISNVFFYNKALSQQEILQNYYQAPIVTDGLVLALDAGNLVSYETGTTINDLTSYNNNGTLINGVGFSNQGVPRFILDGTNDRINVPKDLNGFEHNIQYDINWTIECWMYMYTPDASPQSYKGIYGNYSGCNYSVYPGNAQGFIIFSANNPATVSTNFGFGPKSPSGCPDSVSWNNSESSWVYDLAINKWCHFIITSDDGTYYKIYVNGVQRGSTKTFDFKNSASRTANNLTSTSNYSWGGSFVSNEANEIDFSSMRIYNRPLSSSEILQNFNAQRASFGI